LKKWHSDYSHNNASVTSRAQTASDRGTQACCRRGNSGGPVGRMHAALATAVKTDPDWKEF
jgi:hypothetical protein